MTQPLTFDEFHTLAQQAKRIAVFREIPLSTLTPMDCYQKLCDVYGEKGVMLENLREQEATRYAYLGFDSMASLALFQADGENPFTHLRQLQTEYTFATRDAVANRINCAMGFITYDAARYFEAINDRHPHDPLQPLLLFHFYALSLTFDHHNQTLLISYVVDVSDDHHMDYQRAQHKITHTLQQLNEPLPIAIASSQCDLPQCGTPHRDLTTVIDVDISDDDFMVKIDQAKAFIVAGDAFQIVLSRCFTRHYAVEPIIIYQALCKVSPSPFMFYFPTEQGVILGASPERMISGIDRQVVVNPIAGTRQRRTGRVNDTNVNDTSVDEASVDEASIDDAIAADLLHDEKEVAEHMMLVDLARNDIGAVSVPGSVTLRELLHVKHYSHVSHITSTVTGQLQDHYDAYDAFTHAFPAGTLSGAPKIRAMDIIDALEVSRRGIYGGAICRIDARGNFDSCIAIRMAILQDGLATIRVGAGIVYDSDPAAEAQETHQKARAMLQAFSAAHGE